MVQATTNTTLPAKKITTPTTPLVSMTTIEQPSPKQQQQQQASQQQDQQKSSSNQNRQEWDALLTASMKNDVETIRRLIEEEGVDPCHSNLVGQSALHIACFWGNVEAVETLLTSKNNNNSNNTDDTLTLSKMVNAKNRITGATPLHSSIQSKGNFPNRFQCVSLLLNLDVCDATIVDDYGNTSLDYLYDLEDELRYYLEQQEENEKEEKEMYEVIGLLEEKCSLGSVKEEDVCGEEVRLCRQDLWKAIQDVDLEGVECCVEKLIDITARNEEQADPKEEVAGIKEEEKDVMPTPSVLEFRKTTSDGNSITPFLLAINQLLSLLGHDDDDHPNEEQTPNIDQQGSQLVSIIQFLIQIGYSNVNATPMKALDRRRGQGDDGEEDPELLPIHHIMTALYTEYKSSGNQEENEIPQSILLLRQTALAITKQLAKTSTEIPTPTISILHDASRRGILPMVSFLIADVGININQRGRQGLTPLHFAARSGRVEVVQWLLEYGKEEGQNVGVDWRIRDDRGKTVLDAARANNKLEVVDLLVKYCDIDDDGLVEGG